MFYSTVGARAVSATKRKCYFHDEKLLDYYTNYTRANCLMECAFKYTKGLCGCVPYFYPSKNYVSNLYTRPCILVTTFLFRFSSILTRL